jgi:hypothetical protein
MYVFFQLHRSYEDTHPNAVYLLHAYDYSPDDPVICLSLAIASIGRAMQRQSDNRHHLVTQVRAGIDRLGRVLILAVAGHGFLVPLSYSSKIIPRRN